MSVINSTGSQESTWGIFNPISPEFKQAEAIFHELKDWQKTLVVIASIAGGLFFVIGAFPVFCWTVHAIKPGQNTAADKINETVGKSVVPPERVPVEAERGLRTPISSTNANPSPSSTLSAPVLPGSPVSNSTNPSSKAKSPGKLPTQPTSQATLSTPPTAEQIEASQALLEEISQKYKNGCKRWDPKEFVVFHEVFCDLKVEFKSRVHSRAVPDKNALSSPILECQEDEETYFLPIASLTFNDHYDFNPSNLEELTFLKETLQAAFMTGKKLVVVRLANHIHTVAAGFSADGQFKIIDSMGGRAIDINALTKQLNQAAIKNPQGKTITFKGEYINTLAQIGGHECIRFATLYCYQMFKRKSLDAYEEVNGAFAEGKLRRYEDYKKINGSKKIRTLKNHNRSAYKDFMRSWAYRTKGIEQDNWEEIPVQMLDKLPCDYNETLSAYCLQKKPDLLPQAIYIPTQLIFVNTGGNEVVANTFSTMPQAQEIPLSEEDYANTLGSLASPNEKRLLVFETGNPVPRLYRWLPNQRLFTVDYDGTTRSSVDL